MIKLSEYAKLLTERYGNQKKLRGIWYHGTSAKHLSSILVNGLIPDPKEKVWDKQRKNNYDNNISAYSVSLESYGGIYMTRRLTTAYSAALNSSNKTRTNPVIVVLSMMPKNLIVDEDALAPYFLTYPHDVLVPLYKTLVYGGNVNEKMELDKEKKSFIQYYIRNLCKTYKITNSNLVNRLTELISEEGFKAVVWRAASHSRDYIWKDAFYDYVLSGKSLPNKPSQEECEKNYRAFIDKLTKTLKAILLISPDETKSDQLEFNPMHVHGRSLEPIRFSGKNKIISIFEFKESQTQQFATDVHLKYGLVPEKFVSEYKSMHFDFTIDKIIDDRKS